MDGKTAGQKKDRSPEQQGRNFEWRLFRSVLQAAMLISMTSGIRHMCKITDGLDGQKTVLLPGQPEKVSAWKQFVSGYFRKVQRHQEALMDPMLSLWFVIRLMYRIKAG